VRQCCRARSQILPSSSGIQAAVIPPQREKAAACWQHSPAYAAFCPAFNVAHLALWAAAILLRPAAEMVCLAGAEPVVFATGSGPFRTSAHLAFCALAIFRREATEIIRVTCFPFRDVWEPFSDSITEIAWPIITSLRATTLLAALHEGAEAHGLVRFAIIPPQD
jgi:hypothetical protein